MKINWRIIVQTYLDNLSKRIMQISNNTPVGDFDGFTPAEMFRIIYSPFSAECPIQLNFAGKEKEIRNNPVYKIFSDLLLMAKNSKGIKLTKKGNLLRKIINEIYNKRYLPNELIDKGTFKLRSETDWWILHTIKIVLLLSRLTRKQHNKIMLTRKGQTLLEQNKIVDLFSEFLKTHATKFNWAYNDRFGNERAGQLGFLYLLYLVAKYGARYKNIQYYADLYYNAFPAFLQDDSLVLKLGGEVQLEFYNSVIFTRFFDRFAGFFGFVDLKVEKDDLIFKEKARIKRTKLLSEVLTTYKNSDQD